VAVGRPSGELDRAEELRGEGRLGLAWTGVVAGVDVVDLAPVPDRVSDVAVQVVELRGQVAVERSSRRVRDAAVDGG